MASETQFHAISDTTKPMRYTIALSDGNRYELKAPMLIGRNPQPMDLSPQCNLVPVVDPNRSVSKTHLLIAFDAAGPYLVDQQSTNGTLVSLPDGQQIICGPGQKVRVPAFTTVFFGQFTARIEVHL